MGRPDFSKPSQNIQTLVGHASTSRVHNIITYRLDGKLAYVTAATTHEQAIAYARKVFPQELKAIDSRQIEFSVGVVVQDRRQPVVIGPMAWPTLISRLEQYEVLDITVNPKVVVHRADDDDPHNPNKGYRQHPSSHRPSSKRISRSRSDSREGSPGIRARAKSWFGKHAGSDNA